MPEYQVEARMTFKSIDARDINHAAEIVESALKRHFSYKTDIRVCPQHVMKVFYYPCDKCGLEVSTITEFKPRNWLCNQCGEKEAIEKMKKTLNESIRCTIANLTISSDWDRRAFGELVKRLFVAGTDTGLVIYDNEMFRLSETSIVHLGPLKSNAEKIDFRKWQ